VIDVIQADGGVGASELEPGSLVIERWRDRVESVVLTTSSLDTRTLLTERADAVIDP
jgi:hypothetical protein